MPPLVAHLGIPGSFSHASALNLFGKDCQCLGFSSFPDIFTAVSDGRARYGVVPLENSVAGSIYENYDLLNRHALKICGESRIRVSHFLCAPIGASTKTIRSVYSHFKALEQCGNFLEPLQVTREMVDDTASAARLVAERKDPTTAAICSKYAAELYGLVVIAPDIEDNRHNTTRFVVISKDAEPLGVPNKCSLIYSLPHRPRALLHALETLACDEINITKIESRPIPESPFEYVFYIDLEFEPAVVSTVQKRIARFEESVLQAKNLGMYARARA